MAELTPEEIAKTIKRIPEGVFNKIPNEFGKIIINDKTFVQCHQYEDSTKFMIHAERNGQSFTLHHALNKGEEYTLFYSPATEEGSSAIEGLEFESFQSAWTLLQNLMESSGERYFYNKYFLLIGAYLLEEGVIN